MRRSVGPAHAPRVLDHRLEVEPAARRLADLLAGHGVDELGRSCRCRRPIRRGRSSAASWSAFLVSFQVRYDCCCARRSAGTSRSGSHGLQLARMRAGSPWYSARAVGLPGEHLVGHVLHDLRRIADDDFARRNLHARRARSVSAPTMHPAPIVGVVHDDGVHADRARSRPRRAAVQHGPVPDVRRVLEHDRHAREHVDGAVLLHVAAVAR